MAYFFPKGGKIKEKEKEKYIRVARKQTKLIKKSEKIRT